MRLNTQRQRHSNGKSVIAAAVMMMGLLLQDTIPNLAKRAPRKVLFLLYCNHMSMFGQKNNYKKWTMPDGTMLICEWRTIHILWSPIADTIKWYISGEKGQEGSARSIAYSAVKKMYRGIEIPHLDFRQQYGGLIVLGILLAVGICSFLYI